MRRILGLLALAAAAPAAAQQPQGQPQRLEVTVTEAVRRALMIQPAIIQANGDRRNAGAGMRSALGAFLPSLSVSGSAARSNVGRTDFTTGRPVPSEYSYTSSLSANLDLFTGFRRLANRSAAASNQDAADAGYVNQEFQVTVQTKQLFYNAIATEELVRVADAQVRRAQQQLQISVEKLRAGSATRSDSLRSIVDLGNARLALLQAQANLATAQANLGRQIGVDQQVRAIPDSSLPALPDTAALRSELMDHAPQVQQADAQARAAGAQVWAARSQYFPSLNVSYGDNRQGTASPSLQRLLGGGYPETYSWRFGLSWTLFNGFAREQQQVSAAVSRDVAKARADDTRRQVNASLTQQIAAVTTAFAKLDITASTVAAASEDLRVQQERYRVGAATILDLLTSQANLTQAQQNQVQARFDYLIARAQLEALVGRTL
jgi:outer membrane protein TolC